MSEEEHFYINCILEGVPHEKHSGIDDAEVY